jgi:hypothetical protein
MMWQGYLYSTAPQASLKGSMRELQEKRRMPASISIALQCGHGHGHIAQFCTQGGKLPPWVQKWWVCGHLSTPVHEAACPLHYLEAACLSTTSG